MEHYFGFEEAFAAVKSKPSLCESTEHFSTTVKTSIHIGRGKIAEDVQPATIRYSIEMPVKEHGISGIAFIPTGNATVSYQEVDSDGNGTEKEVVVDFSTATIVWVKGDGIYPIELEFDVDNAGNAGNIRLTCAFWHP